MRRCLLPALLLLACNPAAAPADTDSSATSSATSDTSTPSDTSTTSDDATSGEPTSTGAPDSETDSEGSSTGEVADTHDTDVSPVEFQCQPGVAPSDPFIDCVESFLPEGAVFGQDRFPEVVYGPPVAGSPNMGSLDVLSLGCGGAITLYFDEPAIVDGPGPDFIVFENPLPVGMSTFVEPARVLVSADGLDWREFPCATDVQPPLGCAGVAQVFAGPDNMLDPTDPAAAGGDAFDLAELGLTRARYVRLRDVGVAYYGARTWCGGAGGGFDLDAIAVVHGGV